VCAFCSFVQIQRHRLQVATGHIGDFFGEKAVTKIPRCQHSVLATSLVKVILLNKWDAMRMLSSTSLHEISKAGIVGEMDEQQLKDHFYRCGRLCRRSVLSCRVQTQMQL
jgi:hypothetical protein